MNKINVINPIQFIFLFFFFHNDYFYLIKENCLEKNGESIRGENIEKKFVWKYWFHHYVTLLYIINKFNKINVDNNKKKKKWYLDIVKK